MAEMDVGRARGRDGGWRGTNKREKNNGDSETWEA